MTTTLRVALPRAGALTDVVLSEPGVIVTEDEIIGVRRRLASDLAVEVFGNRTRPIRVDAYRLQLALSSPERLTDLQNRFEPTPASARRSVGISAVASCLREASLAPAAAVERMLAAATREVSAGGRAWWEDWYTRLPRAAQYVVQAEATTWATQLFESLEWWRFEPPARIGADLRWVSGRSEIDLRAKVDVRVSTGERPVFFVVQTGIAPREWTAALALPALVAALAQGHQAVPARVVGYWPASGQVRILPIEPGTLERAARFCLDSSRVLRRFSL